MDAIATCCIEFGVVLDTESSLELGCNEVMVLCCDEAIADREGIEPFCMLETWLGCTVAMAPCEFIDCNQGLSLLSCDCP